MLYSLIISLICFGAALVIILWQTYNIRRGRVILTHRRQPSLRKFLIKTFDALILYGVLVIRNGMHYGYIYLLLAIKKGVSWSKHQIGRLERRVGRSIYSTHSHDKIDHGRRDTSLFLREIKNHQDQVKRDLRAF